jgi:hypothetical protein
MRCFAWLALALLGALAAPRPARACGGFFQSVQVVDQAGETIVYALERDGTLTMAVQIDFEGESEDFAWILPVMAPPEIALGTEALFEGLRAATAPTFIRSTRTDGVCRSYPQCVYADGAPATSGCSLNWGAGGGGGGTWSGGYVDASGEPPPWAATDAGAVPEDGGATVLSEEVVGPYDTVVLGASTAADVVEWLQDHDYEVPQSAIPLLEAYEGARQIFVAMRLSADREASQIRPIVLRMPTSDACLPIRLTAISTVPELPITAFFLADAPVVPLNYSHAEVDTRSLDFWQPGTSWERAVSRAVSELGGQAFVTEYAGATPALSLALPPIEDLASEPDPSELMVALRVRGYAEEPVLRELLERYLVPPEGMDARSYHDCLLRGRSTASCGEPLHFDPERLVAAIEAHIAVPRREAEALVHRHGRLTRLFTTSSADSMTLDPVFARDEGAPTVSNVHEAILVTRCSDQYYPEDAPEEWHLDGAVVPWRAGSPADDAAYCRARGLYLAGTEPQPRARRGGCGCGVRGDSALQWGSVILAALVILARRRRHG